MARRSVTVECARCGNQQSEPRASRYPEELFLEVWHEFMELQAQYKRLLREHRRLEVRHGHTEDALASANFLLRHLDPFLPAWLQNAEARAAEPGVYAALENLPPPVEATAEDPFS